MIKPDRMTAEEFAEQQDELPEGGRWHELHSGHPVLMEAPGDDHGNVVMNISRELGKWFQTLGPGQSSYAVHDLGLLVSRDPDTIYVPAISFFDCGPLFSQTGLLIATQIPRLVVDIASANDRRRDMRLRTAAYLNLGIDMIWIPDPFKKEIQVLRRSLHTLALGMRQTLEGGQLLPGFQMAVADVFAQPSWWTRSSPASETES